MNKKIIIKYLSDLLIISIIFYPISQINFLLFHTLIEITAIILLMTTTIIGINTCKLTKNNVIKTLGYGFFGFSIFTLLHALSYEGIVIVSFGKNFYRNSYVIADLILAINFFIAVKEFDNKIKWIKKIKHKNSIYIYSMLLLLLFYIITKIELKKEIIYIIKIFTLILFIQVLMIFEKKKKEIGNERFEGFRTAFISVLITMVLSLYYKNPMDVAHIVAHIFKLLAIYYIYKSLILETLTNPMGDMFSKLNQMQKKLVFENIKLADELKLEKRIEEKLKKYKMAMEQSLSSIIIFNREGRVNYINKKVLETTLFTKDEIMNKTIEEINNCTKLKRNLILEEKLSKKKKWNGELCNQKKNGESYWENVSFSPIKNRENEIIGFLKISEDVTEKKEMEKKLQEQIIEIKKVNKLKDEFLANMSHEIRTPMNGIIGSVNLLLDTEQNIEQEEYSNMIKDSAQSLLIVINKILDFSKIEKGKIELNEKNTNIYELIEKIEVFFSSSVYEKNINLRYKIDDDVPENLIMDFDKIQRVLINLVGNAFKFTEEGIIKINIKKEKIENNKVVLLFSVKDTGIGIELEKQEEIFKKFIQEDGSITRSFGGTGLGLSICKKIIEFMGGEIWVESVKGEGSTFYFRLELKIGNTVKSKNKDKNINLNKFKEKKYKILLGEDDELNQKIEKRYLEKMNLDVTIANNGIEVIEKFAKGRFDLILMDIQMPKMGGFEATTKIKESEKYKNKNIPIVALTAHAIKGYRQKCIKAGMRDYISKPITEDELYRIMEKYLLQINKKIDLVKLEENFEKDFVKEIINDFLDYFPEILENIKKGIREREYDKIRKNAHKIKGSLSNFMAKKGMILSEELEQLAKEEKMAEIKKKYSEFEEELFEIKEIMQEY